MEVESLGILLGVHHDSEPCRVEGEVLTSNVSKIVSDIMASVPVDILQFETGFRLFQIEGRWLISSWDTVFDNS